MIVLVKIFLIFFIDNFREVWIILFNKCFFGYWFIVINKCFIFIEIFWLLGSGNFIIVIILVKFFGIDIWGVKIIKFLGWDFNFFVKFLSFLEIEIFFKNFWKFCNINIVGVDFGNFFISFKFWRGFFFF